MRSWPSTSTNMRSSMPIRRASSRLRSFTSGYSISMVAFQSVRDPHQRDRVLQPRIAQPVHVESLVDVVAGQRAVGADVVGRAARRMLGHALEERLADLHRDFVRSLLHAVGAGVARAALVR